MTKENIYKNSFGLINEFFSINQADKDFGKNLFETLKKIINFESGYIIFINPEQIRVEYSYNSILKDKVFNIDNKESKKLFTGNFDKKITKLLSINCDFLAEPLILKGTIYGYIIITMDNINDDLKNIFKSCSTIIANLVKDSEINKIISLQVKTFQEGITDIQHENLKILEADKVKNDFLANISHELRTPLNSIIGFSEFLSKEFVGELNQKQKEYVNDIQISSLHLMGMINEILDISKIEANASKLNKIDFDIEQSITEVCNIIKPIVQKKNISLTIKTESFILNADYQKIQQIIFNLLSNAIKFTPKNGKILISTFSQKSNIVIKIKDNGIGIDKKNHEKIFNKFEQIENTIIKNESSTGLGLTITKELVKMHNGSIKLQSELEKGSTFTIHIPFK